MVTNKFDETPIDNDYCAFMKAKYFFDLPTGYSGKLLTSIVQTMGKVLHDNPNKNEGVHGFYYKDPNEPNEANKKKIFAGILEYDKNEDNPDQPGAYEFTLSYDPEIIEKADTDANDPIFSAMLHQVLSIEYGIYINDPSMRYTICSSLLAFVKQYIENQINANPNETYEFDIPGMLTITGGIEDNAIVISVLPGADLKSKYIKDDAASEKA